MKVSLHVVLPILTVLFSVRPWYACAVELNGAGASFPYDVYSAWMPAYKAHRRPFRHLSMRYESIGSGGGKARIKGETAPAVAYAGSDSVLKDDEYQAHPDLQMLPSMAGAVVLAFNLPGVSELRLSMTHIVGIYNGSILLWNDSSIDRLNPQLSLPGESIRVVARRDKSGTTELFTGALSAADPRWRTTYGTFSDGLGADERPYVWEGSVVTLYAETNRGMSGVVLSTKFSVGYLVHSDAAAARLRFATLLNTAGNLVEATALSVQSAMDDFADSFSPRITRSLANPPGLRSYPISGYTYFIIHITSMTDCQLATELVRYIEWFYTNSIARVECENLHMVPLSRAVYEVVVEQVLKRVQCRGRNVYKMVQAEKHEEQVSLQTWRTPVYVAVPVIVALLFVLMLYLVRDQIRTNRAMLRDEWRIQPDSIEFGDLEGGSFGFRHSVSKSRCKVHPSMSRLDSSTGKTALSLAGLRVGSQKGVGRVLLRELPMLSGAIPLAMKRGLLKLRDHVIHDNLTRFYGLYLQQDKGLYCSVSQFCSKGDLQHLLHGTKYHLDNSFKFALCVGVAEGIEYLHSQKLIHASLTSNKIYLDNNWSVRVSGWEADKIAKLQRKNWVSVEMGVTEWAKDEFWTAPEVLSQRSIPTMAADVYSFAIVMQEIFSRDTPYSETTAFLSPGQALEMVVCQSLRPVFTADTPLEARDVMQRAWEMDPVARPPMTALLDMMHKACPKTRSVMDSMLDSLMQYVAQLEDTSRRGPGMLEHKSTGDPHPNGATHQQRLDMLPPGIGRAVDQRELLSQRLDSVSVLIVRVHGMDTLWSVSTPQELTELLTGLDQILNMALEEWRYKDVAIVNVTNDVYTVAAGLLQPGNADHLKVIAALALCLMSMATTSSFRHPRENRLRLRIGLGTGSAVVGLAGHDVRHFTMFGEALSCAHQLADTCRPMAVHLNGHTHLALATFNYFRCIENTNYKEKQEWNPSAMKTYWLVGHREMTETYLPEI